MISDLLLDGAAIAVLFALAGLALERIAVWIGVARRGAWAVTLVLSVAFPTMRVLAPHPSPPPPSTHVVQSNPRSEEASNIAAPAVRASYNSAPHSVVEERPRDYLVWPSQVALERVLWPLWLTTSLGLVGFY